MCVEFLCNYDQGWLWRSFNPKDLFRGYREVGVETDINKITNNHIICFTDAHEEFSESMWNSILSYPNPITIFAGLTEVLNLHNVYNLLPRLVTEGKKVIVFVDNTNKSGVEEIKTLCTDLGVECYDLEGFRNCKWGLEDPDLENLKGTSVSEICQFNIDLCCREKPRKVLYRTRRLSVDRIYTLYTIVSNPKYLSHFEVTANVGYGGKQYTPVAGILQDCRDLEERTGIGYEKYLDVANRPWYGLENQDDNGGLFVHEHNMYPIRKHFLLELVAENPGFQTEKVFKPMMWGIPCFYLGPRGTIKKLHDQGFWTFGEWWDESYDDLEYDELQKTNIVLEEISKILSKTTTELFRMYEEMIPVLEHNARVLDTVPDTIVEAYEALKKVSKKCISYI